MGGTVRAALASIGILVCLSLEAHAQANCAALIEEAKALARDVTASLRKPDTAEVGGPVGVTWSNRSRGRTSLPPVYLVVTAPVEVRFAGTGFIALAPRAKGPEGLAFGSDGARAVLPLHRAHTLSGEIIVKPYRAGRNAIAWTVVTTGPCGEQVLARGQDTIEVRPGSAELVLQERFRIEQPLTRIRARSGRHDLLVFKERYEVHEVATGAKIIDRPGEDPNFSPTGRFVAARAATDRSIDILDTVSGEKIASLLGGVLAWSRADSFALHGGNGNGNIAIVNMMADDAAIGWVGGMWTLACRICEGWSNVDVVIDIDRGYAAAVGNLGGRFADLYTRRSGNAMERMGDPQTKQPQRSIIEGAIRQRYHPSFAAFSKGWTFVGDAVALSHPSDVSQALQRQPIPPDQQRILVTHSVVSNVVANTPSRAVGVELVPADVSSRGLRGTRSADRSVASVAYDHLERAVTVTHLPVPVTHAHGGKVFENQSSAPLKAAITELVRQVPGAAATLRDPPDAHQCALDSKPGGALSVPASWVSQIYRWQAARGSAWLLQTLCYAGSASMLNENDVVLVNEGSAGPTFRSILKALGKTGEASNGMVHDANQIRLFVSTDAHLIIASPLNENAAVINAVSAERVGAVVPLVNTDLLQELRRSRDGKHLVQLNTDGGFYVYRIVDGKRLLRGAIVDDEVIVATDDGLYDNDTKARTRSRSASAACPACSVSSSSRPCCAVPALPRRYWTGPPCRRRQQCCRCRHRPARHFRRAEGRQADREGSTRARSAC